METTTVKLKKTTKSELDRLREQRESYDDVVQRLIIKTKDKGLKRQLIDGYKSIGKEELNLLEEWEHTSSELS